MPKPVFNEEKCKGCELCTIVCPKKIVIISDRFNSKGYRPAMCINEKECTGCTLCAKTCPDMVIEIHK
jgi:2-oxoglutarate ferredoxin oxidoreductase subunit delta